MRDDYRYIVACHEAGHAVAAVLRGGTVTCIKLCPNQRTEGDAGITGINEPQDWKFVAYSGPWAEARACWSAESICALDSDGRRFDEAVGQAFLSSPRDLYDVEGNNDAIVARIMPPDAWQDPLPPLPEGPPDPAWHCELEAQWPTMRKIALVLLDYEGKVPTSAIQSLLDEIGV